MVKDIDSLSSEYLDERFKRVEDRIEALKTLLEQRADAGDEALKVAKVGLNEMRGMAMDQQSMFLTKTEYEAKHDSILVQIANLKDKVTAMIAGKSETGKVWYVVATILSILIAIGATVAGIFVRH